VSKITATSNAKPLIETTGRKLVRLQTFIGYDMKRGFVWPQLYDKPYLNFEMNFPHAPLRLVSDPYWSDGSKRTFGIEIPVLNESYFSR
jgi:hypothetical protein